MEVWHFGQTNAGGAGLDDAAAISLLSALGADAVNLKGVAGCQVVVLAPNFLFHFSNLGRKKFHRCATLGANHMVMAPPIVLMFVAGDAVVKRHRAGQAAIRQEL